MKRINSFICILLAAVLALSISAITVLAAEEAVTVPYECKYDYTLEEPSETEVYGAFETTMITRKLDTGVVAMQIPTNGVKEGYTTYKLEAKNGGTIESLKLTLSGRITNPAGAGNGVLILTVSASNDNQNWTELDKKTCVDSMVDYAPLEITLPESLTGKTTIYVKLTVELSADAPSYAHDWINFTVVHFEGTQRYVPAPDDGKTRYSVTFSKGDDAATGRDPQMDDQVVGDAIILPKRPYKRTGAEFVGWSDGTNVYPAESEYTMPASDVHFTAQWNYIKYNITFAEGPDSYTGSVYAGTVPPAAQAEYQEEYVFPENPFTCEGRTFAGWRVGNRLFAPGEKLVMDTADVVVYPYFVSEPNGAVIDLGAILDNDEFAFLIQGKETDKLMSYLYDSYLMSGRATVSNPDDPGYFVTQWNEVFGADGKFDGYYYSWMTFCLDVGESKQFDDLLIRMSGRVANYGADYTEMNVYYSYDNENWELANNTVGAFPENGLQSTYNFALADHAAGYSKLYVRFEYIMNNIPDYGEDWIGITAIQFEGYTVDKANVPAPTEPTEPTQGQNPTDPEPTEPTDTQPSDGLSPIVIAVICVAAVAVIAVAVVIVIKKRKNS